MQGILAPPGLDEFSRRRLLLNRDCGVAFDKMAAPQEFASDLVARCLAEVAKYPLQSTATTKSRHAFTAAISQTASAPPSITSTTRNVSPRTVTSSRPFSGFGLPLASMMILIVSSG